jgi:hypothetical protein
MNLSSIQMRSGCRQMLHLRHARPKQQQPQNGDHWSDGLFDGTAAYTLVDLGNNKTAWKPPEHATTTTPSPVC